MGTKENKKIMKALYGVILGIVLICVLTPFIWMVLASLKKIVDILNPERIFIFTPTLKNYREVFVRYRFEGPIFNSLFIGVTSTLLACLFGLPTAYSIARFKQNMFASLILFIRVIPAISFLVPWYIIFSKLNLSGTFYAMIIAHTLVSLPFIIWIMIPYFESIPHELEEAAHIDGSSILGSFLTIMIPLSMPGILTASIISFIFSWNNFMLALVLSSSKTKTLPMAVFNFISYTDVDWGGLMAAAVIITGPVVIISLLLQKYVISGLTAGAVKG